MNSLDSNPSQQSPPIKKRRLFRIFPLVLLLVLVLGVTIPNYVQGTWSWKQPIPVENISKLRKLRETGLTIPGWNTVEQLQIPIGGQKWSVQLIEKEGRQPIQVLLLPQKDHNNQPQVDWVDIEGFEGWKSDSYNTLKFLTAEARFFRAWSRTTYAVVQWYAMPQGGNPSPGKWFWADQIAQLKDDRVPWIAVCLKIPIKPLGDLEIAREDAKALAETIQTTLQNKIFKS